MRISDWSSDVCSSDLRGTNMATATDAIDQLGGYDTADLGNATLSSVAPISTGMLSAMGRNNPAGEYDNGQVWVQAIGNSGSLAKQIGRASCRERVCPYV